MRVVENMPLQGFTINYGGINIAHGAQEMSLRDSRSQNHGDRPIANVFGMNDSRRTTYGS
jgi:hypothetical protein